jgi:hypothetical protein
MVGDGLSGDWWICLSGDWVIWRGADVVEMMYFGAKYHTCMNRACILALMVVLYACTAQRPPENPDAWKKIKLDFKEINAEGLSGPPKGKVAVNYEFCIPAEEKYWRQVRKTDSSARKNTGKGRVGCTEKQWLVIGSTHQKNYQRILFQLASLPYVEQIQQTYWE